MLVVIPVVQVFNLLLEFEHFRMVGAYHRQSLSDKFKKSRPVCMLGQQLDLAAFAIEFNKTDSPFCEPRYPLTKFQALHSNMCA